MPAKSSLDTFLWRTGRLVGSDPAKATHYRCMASNEDGTVCTKGKLCGLVKFSSNNTSNILSTHYKKKHGTLYDTEYKTCPKSLSAAQHGAHCLFVGALSVDLLCAS